MREQVLSELHLARQRHDAELRALIVQAAHGGASSHAIAEALGISRATLWRRYGRELSRRGPRPRAQ